MADGYVGLWPVVGGLQGEPPASSAEIACVAAVTGQPLQAAAGSSSSKASVTGEAAVTHVEIGSAFAVANVSGVDPFTLAGWRSFLPLVSALAGTGGHTGAIASAASVSGEAKAVIVRDGAASSAAQVEGYDNSTGTGAPAYRGFLPLVGVVNASTASLPVGATWTQAYVAGEGVYSVLGDYATLPRSVFDVPPPRDFLPPGVTLDYGGPVSLRPASALSGEVWSIAAVSGQLRAAVVVTAAAAAEAAVSGQLRAVVALAGASTSVAQVSGQALGIITTTGTGSVSSVAEATGQDRSLAEGVALGITAAYASATGEGVAENAQAGAVAAEATASGVDASGYPLAAPAGSSSSMAECAGEAVATIVRTAQAHAAAALAGVQATLAIAEASASSMAAVSGANAGYRTVAPGGRWPRPMPRQDGSSRYGTGNTRRPVNSS